ncbi:MAG: PAS domain-containing protein [Polyangiaceae bacterium]|nr:PAS domain-containing protein [Polyangiaceae bacterium]
MAETSSKPSAARRVVETVLLAACYYAFARLGLELAHVGSNVTLVWPPTGIAVAALVAFGPRCWPGVFLAAMLVNAEMGTPWWAAIAVGIGNSAGPTLVAVALRRARFRPFETLRDTMTFLVVTPLGMLVAPTVALLALNQAGLVPHGFLGRGWILWWVGDLNGVLVVGTALLTIRRDAFRALGRHKLELLFITATTLLVVLFVFFLVAQPFTFIVLLPVVWAALRFPGLGSSLVVLGIATAAVWATATHRGPFASPDVQSGLLVLSGFLGSAALGNLIVMALLAEQREVRRALEASEADRIRALEAGAVGMWDYDLETRKLIVDEGTVAIWGVPREELEQKTFALDAIHPGDRQRVLELLDQTWKSGERYDATFRIYRRDGALRWVASRGKCFRDAADKATRMAGVVQDVTARTEAEQAKRSADERLAIAARLAGLGTWQLDLKSHRLTLSEELAGMLGRQDLVTSSCDRGLELLHPDDRRGLGPTLARALEPGAIFQTELRVSGPNQEQRILLVCGARTGAAEERRFVGAALDITPRREEEAARQRLERRLAQAHRTEALGRLAGGIAHDFNNLLAAILPNVELLSMDIGRTHSARESVDAIRDATLRARDLVKQVLAFAQQRGPTDRAVEMAPLIEETLRLMQASQGAPIEVRKHLASGIYVVADPSRLHQVVANLVTNAAQSMSAGGGLLEVSLAETVVDEASASTLGIAAGRFARLEVRDSGHGIDTAHLGRIFDPFFTTKSSGGGTGLGLAVVHAIVHACAGAITTRSKLGRGTVFSVYLPLTSAPVVTPEPERSEPRGRGQAILVVDDEPAVLSTTRRVLERLGYEVISADGPRSALAELGSAARIDLLLTDLSMPEMTGLTLAVEARRTRPKLPVVISTGFGAAVDESELAAAGVHEVLAKPVTSDVLARSVSEALGSPR